MIPSQQTQIGIKYPFSDREKAFNSMNPDNILPEDKERFDKLKSDFDKNYREKLEVILGKSGKSLLSKIAGLYEKQDGNFEKAVSLGINSLNLKQEEKQELKELIFKQISNQNKKEDENEGGEDKDKEDSAKDVENEKKQQKIEEGPYSPIVNRFIKNPKIDIDEKLGIKIKEALLNLPKKNPEDPEDVLKESLDDALDNLEIDSYIKSHLIESILYLEKPSTIEENKQNFEKNFKDELIGFKEEYGQEDEKGEKQFTGVVKDVVETLGSNYFIEGKNNGNLEYEKKKSVDTAFEISANKIIQGKQIKRDFTFEAKLENIKNEDNDFSSKLKDLIDLANLVNTKQGEEALRIEELIDESEENGNEDLRKQYDTIAYLKVLEAQEKLLESPKGEFGKIGASGEAGTSAGNVSQLSSGGQLDKQAILGQTASENSTV